ncbi:glycosyltransferase family 4 protein [Marinobacter sp. X15-166B]|uniref:glycosyltransferase family 4 protein n=1 Tax=Marinobacter sp. X15-166B TaxID=1897620 RepID=UPI00085C0D0D|nr:glycosyltransferase family 4 protein [Marinobacter sp. X15-166B]OEY66597.1 glycosyl transferase [Marinobacter sp. X15-166B]
MKVLQVLPALHSGGVERGTVEFAADLVKQGHESIVVSSGGPLVAQLEKQGSRHIDRPVHRKSPASLLQVAPMRALLQELQADIVHVRSRVPAWITWLAWRKLSPQSRPALVSTFHGMYSVSPYSAIMAKAEHMIAVSECVRDYVLNNYTVDPNALTVIQRGVDLEAFQPRPPGEHWRQTLLNEHPQLAGKRILMMPGRLTRWKGQLQFLDVMAELIRQQPDCHGIIVGGAEPSKEHFMTELVSRRRELGLDAHVSFLGQRGDIAELYRLSDLVCHLSTKPEPFGRTLTEALATGTPVVAFDRGGASEILQACFNEGLVQPDDLAGFVQTAIRLLNQPQHTIDIPYRFRLQAQTEATLGVYAQALARHKEQHRG